MTEKIKIAIIGAGITGICLAHGLRKYPHLDATCYEANSTIREDDGAAVGIGGNGQEALQLISSELRAALDKAGGTTLNPSLRVMIVRLISKPLGQSLIRCSVSRQRLWKARL